MKIRIPIPGTTARHPHSIMREIKVRIEVRGPGRPNGAESLEAMVDTGATLTKIPEAILKQVGIRPVERRRFELADGRRVWRRLGNAVVRIVGHTVACQVSFGKAGEQPLIGVTLLEQAGLAPDPVKRRLVPVDYLMM